MHPFLNWLEQEDLIAYTGEVGMVSLPVGKESDFFQMSRVALKNRPSAFQKINTLFSFPPEIDTWLPALAELDLRHLKRRSIQTKTLSSCSSLRSLFLCYADRNTIDGLTQLQQLNYLALVATLIISEADLHIPVTEAIIKMPNLQKVSIISWSALNHFHDLKRLKNRVFDYFYLEPVDLEASEDPALHLSQLDFVTDLNLEFQAGCFSDLDFLTEMKSLKRVIFDEAFPLTDHLLITLRKRNILVDYAR